MSEGSEGLDLFMDKYLKGWWRETSGEYEIVCSYAYWKRKVVYPLTGLLWRMELAFIGSFVYYSNRMMHITASLVHRGSGERVKVTIAGRGPTLEEAMRREGRLT